MIKTLHVIFLIGFQLSSFANILLPDLTAVYNSRKKAVVIKWRHTTPGVKTYIPERSVDNKIWKNITSQKVDRSDEFRPFFVEDKDPAQGKNHYRLKCIYEDGKIGYTTIVTVMIGSVADTWIIYPVPVTDLLNLDYRGAETIKGVINVIIQHPTGKVFSKLRYSSLSTQIKIPVNHLPKGIYDIRILVQHEVIWDQRFAK